MRGKVVMLNDRRVCGVITEKGDFTVVSLGGAGDIRLGDTVVGDFDGTGGIRKAIQNETQACSVNVFVEMWGCVRDAALEFVNRLCSPERVSVLEDEGVPQMQLKPIAIPPSQGDAGASAKADPDATLPPSP
jgi:hypothetical protein